MDFFKFISDTDATALEQGEKINNIKKSMWVERYAIPGEFKFEAPLSSGLKEFLPPGTLVSHANTLDMMIVENHEIVETESEDPQIVVTGSGFTSYLNNRIVGMNGARTDELVVPYILTANNLSLQIKKLINDHIKDTVAANDALVDVEATSVSMGTEESIERQIDFGGVWDRVSELLRTNDLGIKTIRKNNFGEGLTDTTTFLIHNGTDRTQSVFASWESGDLSSLQYLFSNKSSYNSALVLGQYVYVMVDMSGTKYDRRMMVVDAKDIDGHMGTPDGWPFGTSGFVELLTNRGIQALLAQHDINIIQTDISKSTYYQYRRDYEIGDLITVDGNFGEIVVMRVTEFAEIEDETGESGHPTLSIPGV